MLNRQISFMILAAALLFCGPVACSNDSNDSGPDTNDSTLVTFYNSDLQQIEALSPLETLYVEISGLVPNRYYAVSVEDVNGDTVSKLEVPTDANGRFQRTPLWYDAGLTFSNLSHAQPVVDVSSVLSSQTFTILLTDLADNATVSSQDLFFITPDFTTASQPRPVVCAYYKHGDEYYPENAFEETGSLDVNGEVSQKTKVYVDAKRIPWFIDGSEVTAVDVYVVPFDGDTIDDGEDISRAAVISRTDVPVVNENWVTKQFATPELLWDLNGATTLVNPDETNCAYRVIVDINQNGAFDYGTDVDRDGKTDLYVDGIDGNAEPGFIVYNTPANDVFASIRNGNTPDYGAVNSLYEASVNAGEQLFLFMDNIPTHSDSVRVFVAPYAASAPVDGALLNDVRAGSFSTADVSFPDDSDLRFMPYIEGAELINTSLSDSFSYGQNIAEDTKLSIVVDINSDGIFDSASDIFLSDTTNPPAYILMIAEEAGVETYPTEVATEPTRSFEETGSGTGNSVVWVDISGTLTNDVSLALFARKNWADNDSLSASRLTATYSNGDDRYEFWDLDADVQVKNPDSNSGQYDIVIDYGNDQVFNEGVDLVIAVTIIDTPANDLPRVQYANVASSGNFYSGDYGYRDTFLSDCTDTHSSSYVSAGIKAIWNPYIKQYDTAEGDTTRTLYQGNYVDLYIVSTAIIDLNDWESIVLTDSIEATGRHKTLPVQYSCGNGAGMQNIWTPTLTAGSYYVIIDVNQNGQIDEGVDIIDAVNEAGDTIMDDDSIPGFGVDP